MVLNKKKLGLMTSIVLMNLLHFGSNILYRRYCQLNFEKVNMNTLKEKGRAYMLVSFLAKKDSHVRKKVHLRALYRCDQAMKDVQSIPDAILDRFKVGNPLIEGLYIKSDNAGCYHGAVLLEVKVSKQVSKQASKTSEITMIHFSITK